ncbi:hypothetical protein GQ55_7G176000 [Panicum hallii var. hallii]|uniref:HMA domain-containing protein n=1 Tax=Panicum hallii var. hallii TaxID=1504633 RepID=A0A2T7CW60_9POAL|nr:hypothetical protein GQ55_7G176000 [Panicum hallii var. hallii]
MKQKMVIKVSMPCARSRSRAMALAARADGVISMGIAGDSRDKLEVVGDGVDAACLVSCLRRKLGHAEILQVEEVKDKPEEEETTKGPDNTMTAQPDVVEPPPDCHHGYGYYCCHLHPPPPPMVVCDEPGSCTIM